MNLDPVALRLEDLRNHFKQKREEVLGRHANWNAEAESAAATMKGQCPCKDGKKGDAKVWSLAWKGDPSEYDKNGEADPATMPDDHGKRLAPSGSFDSRVVKSGTGGNRFVGGYPNDKDGADPVDETQAEWEKRNKDAGYNNTQYCVTCPGENK